MITFPKQKSSGFTLLEVMITLAILAILAVFALSNYRHYITKSHLQDGKSALQTNYLFLESFYLKHNAYGYKDKTKTPPNDFIPLQVSDLPVKETGSGNAGYIISVHPNCEDLGTDGTKAATFCLKAEPRPGQATSVGGGKECSFLTIDQTGKSLAEPEREKLKNPGVPPKNNFKCF